MYFFFLIKVKTIKQHLPLSTPGSLQGTILFTIENRIASRNFNVWTGTWRASHQDSWDILSFGLSYFANRGL